MNVDNLNELLSRKEELNPELQRYLVDFPTFGKALQHPLVYEVPYWPAMNALINERYKQKLNALEIARKESNWERVIYIHERPYRWEALECVSTFLEKERLAQMFADVWIDSENIWQHQEVIGDLINQVKDTELKDCLMSEDDYLRYQLLPKTVEVYRGCLDHNQQGLSWTLDKEKAIWFAQRFQREGITPMVLSGRVNKSDILFYTDGRSESEVVVVSNNCVEITGCIL